MNISPSNIIEARERDGEPAQERPEYVGEALECRRQVGWKNGKPVVPNPEADGLRLGEDPTEAYSHYVLKGDLILPSSGDFLADLFDSDHIGSFEDAGEELNTDASTVRNAANLHGLEEPDGGKVEAPSPEGVIRLPSGETVPFDPLSPLVLAQLLSDGLGVEEIGHYLSRETDERVTSKDVRQAAREYDLLGGDVPGQPTRNLVTESEVVRSGEGEYSHTPFE